MDSLIALITTFPQPLLVLAHSLGSAVASRLVSAGLFEGARSQALLVLVAPMLDFLRRHSWMRLLQLPIIGEWSTRTLLIPGLKMRRRRRYQQAGLSDLLELFYLQCAIEGFDRALLSMVRAQTLGNQSDCYRNLPRDIRTLVISGANDDVTPADDITEVRQLLPDSSLVTIADAAHNLLLTHPRQVVGTLQNHHSIMRSTARAIHLGGSVGPDLPKGIQSARRT